MNCKKIEEMIDLYIAGELPEDLKLQMEEHLIGCEECNELYNEELFIKATIIGALDLDNVVFQSQKDKIMSSIDKNKYSNININNRVDLYRFIKYFKLGMPVAAAVVFVLLLNPIERFKILENKSSSIGTEEKSFIHTGEKPIINSTEVTNNSKDPSQKADIALDNTTKNENNIDNNIKVNEKAAIKDNTKIKEEPSGSNLKVSENNLENGENTKGSLSNNTENSLALADEKQEENNSSMNNSDEEANINTNEETNNIGFNNQDDTNNNINDFTNNIYYEKETDINVRFNKKLYMDDSIAKVANGWTESPNKQFESLIKVNDIYLDKIYIRDINKNIVWSMEKDINSNNSVPKFIEWYDNENIFVVMNGTEDNIKKEELYLLNVNKGNSTMLYKLYGGSRSIVGINKINTNNVELKLQLNSNDNYLNSNMQSFTLLDIRKDNFYK